MIACLAFPYFASAVERRQRTPSLPDPPPPPTFKKQPGLVIGGQPWEPQAVYAYSLEVAKQGVRPGMSLRLAHFLSPSSQFLPANPPLYLDASAEIVDLLSDFTHLLEPELFWSKAGADVGISQSGAMGIKAGYGPAFGIRLPARYTLNLESLPAIEAVKLVKEMGRTVRRQTRLAPAIGLAENNLVAHIAAVLTKANYARSIPPEEVASFLAARSIRFLALEKETARRLSLLGIRTLGQLVSLPISSATTHLNLDEPSRKALKGLHQMIARDEGGNLNPIAMTEMLPPLQPIRQNKEERLSYHFEPPIADRGIVERAINQAASTLAGRLQDSGQEGRTLCLTLEAEDAIFQEIDDLGQLRRSIHSKAKLSRRHPTADPDQISSSLRELLHEVLTTSRPLTAHQQQIIDRGYADILALETINFDVGLTRLTIEFFDISPTVNGQLTLFEPPRATGQIRESLSNLIGKYKPGIFFKTELIDARHPLLERRFQLEELVVV